MFDQLILATALQALFQEYCDALGVLCVPACYEDKYRAMIAHRPGTAACIAEQRLAYCA